MRQIFHKVALCVVIGCTGSVMGAGADTPAGRCPQQGDGTAMWAAAAPKPEDESGLTWQQVMGIVMLCGGCYGGGALVQNHLYMMTIEGRGVKATAATTKLLVRGGYTIA